MPFSRIVGVGALTLILVGCGGEKQSERAAQETPRPLPPAGPGIPLVAAPERTRAPQFSGADLKGATVRLEDYRGKVVLVDFWATWCGPCRRTIPHLIELQRRHGDRGLVVLGISLDQGGESIVSQYALTAGINYPILVDPPGRLASLFGGVDGIPTIFLIDKSGRLAGKAVGALPRERVERAVETLLLES